MHASACAIVSVALVLFVESPAPSEEPVAPSSELWAVCTGNAEAPSGRLVRIDLASGTVDPLVTIEGSAGEHEPVELAFLPGGEELLVAQLHGAGTARHVTHLQTVVLADGRVRGEVRFDGWLDALEFHPRSGALWGMHCDDQGRRRLVRVDARKGKLEVVGDLPDEEFPRSLAFSPDGRELWALTCTNQIEHDALLLLDPSDAKVLTRFPWTTEKPAHALEIAADGRLIAVEWGGTFYELERANGRPTRLATVSNPTLAGIVTGLDFRPKLPERRPAR